MDIRCRIEMLGGLRVQQGKQVITRFRTHKTGALLAYLAYHLRAAHPREVLINLLWPDCPPADGSRSLSVALSSLRYQLEPAGVPAGVVIVADRFSVRLHPEAVTTDVAAFEAAWQAAQQAESAADRALHLEIAVTLYCGELLPGYYQDWILTEQQRLADLYGQAVHALIGLLEQRGERERALGYAHQAVGIDPLREEAHYDLIRLLAATGQAAAALRQYQQWEQRLQEELGTRPSAACRALAEEIWKVASGEEPNPGTPRSGNAEGKPPGSPWFPLEPVGGALPLDSAFYVVRPTDELFRTALERRDSIVLVQGARQMGKTSLLARGLQQARERGSAVLLTDFQMLPRACLESAESLYLGLAEAIADQLDLDVRFEEVWREGRGGSINLERFLRREVLGPLARPLVWGMDEVDRLFPCDFGSQVFGLFRSWYNRRALDPTGPWSRLTLAIAYATEAHLFISDLNLSPFNVGTRVTLEDLTREQVGELNRRYQSPLRSPEEVERFFRLLNGQPYLVQRGLHEMVEQGMDLATLEAQADQDEGLFGDHLRRLLVALAQDAELTDVVRGLLRGEPCPTRESFYRLRSAGVITGPSGSAIRFRCRLYQTYLERTLL